MALFNFVSWCLVTICAVTLLWPLNIPLIALAYKVRRGYEPIDLEPSALWWRSTFATLGLAGMSLVLLGLLYALVEGAELKPYQVQIVLLMLYLPAAVWYVCVLFAFDDLLDALSLFLLYVLLSGLPLLLIGRIAGWWTALADDLPWLFKPF